MPTMCSLLSFFFLLFLLSVCLGSDTPGPSNSGGPDCPSTGAEDQTKQLGSRWKISDPSAQGALYLGHRGEEEDGVYAGVLIKDLPPDEPYIPASEYEIMDRIKDAQDTEPLKIILRNYPEFELDVIEEGGIEPAAAKNLLDALLKLKWPGSRWTVDEEDVIYLCPGAEKDSIVTAEVISVESTRWGVDGRNFGMPGVKFRQRIFKNSLISTRSKKLGIGKAAASALMREFTITGIHLKAPEAFTGPHYHGLVYLGLIQYGVNINVGLLVSQNMIYHQSVRACEYGIEPPATVGDGVDLFIVLLRLSTTELKQAAVPKRLLRYDNAMSVLQTLIGFKTPGSRWLMGDKEVIYLHTKADGLVYVGETTNDIPLEELGVDMRGFDIDMGKFHIEEGPKIKLLCVKTGDLELSTRPDIEMALALRIFEALILPGSFVQVNWDCRQPEQFKYLHLGEGRSPGFVDIIVVTDHRGLKNLPALNAGDFGVPNLELTHPDGRVDEIPSKIVLKHIAREEFTRTLLMPEPVLQPAEVVRVRKTLYGLKIPGSRWKLSDGSDVIYLHLGSGELVDIGVLGQLGVDANQYGIPGAQKVRLDHVKETRLLPWERPRIAAADISMDCVSDAQAEYLDITVEAAEALWLALQPPKVAGSRWQWTVEKPGMKRAVFEVIFFCLIPKRQPSMLYAGVLTSDAPRVGCVDAITNGITDGAGMKICLQEVTEMDLWESDMPGLEENKAETLFKTLKSKTPVPKPIKSILKMETPLLEVKKPGLKPQPRGRRLTVNGNILIPPIPVEEIDVIYLSDGKRSVRQVGALIDSQPKLARYGKHSVPAPDHGVTDLDEYHKPFMVILRGLRNPEVRLSQKRGMNIHEADNLLAALNNKPRRPPKPANSSGQGSTRRSRKQRRKGRKGNAQP